MDVLSDVLRVVRLTGSVFFTADLHEPWSFSSPGSEVLLKAMPTKAECLSLFHIITEGECWFKTANGEKLFLEKGSVIIFPNGCSHIMYSHANLNPEPILRWLGFRDIKDFPTLKYGGKGARTQFICGYLLCDQKFNPLLGSMPEILILSPENASSDNLLPERKSSSSAIPIESDSWLEVTLKQLIQEVSLKTVGSATLITRFTELMYVEILRRYMKQLPQHSHGWLAGVRDIDVGRALSILHERPEEKWNVKALASLVGVSRSAFAQRFTNLIGESPMRYLTGWRMQLAKNLLLEPRLNIAMVAERVGYESDIAFNRAFKRYVGKPPASWREQALSSNY